MSWKQKAVLAGLAIAFISLSACRKKEQSLVGEPPGPGQHYGQKDMRVFRVYIYADPSTGKCFADWPVGTLWKSKHQTVLWVSDDGGQYTVDFTQGHHSPPPLSPFGSDTFTVSGNGVKPSGDLQEGAIGYYDFAIRSGDTNGSICKDASDPGYIVKP